MTAQLVLLGSGENSPAMVTPHQKIIKGMSEKRYLLDTPSAFQSNSDEVVEKIAKYFEVNVGFPAKKISLHDSEAKKLVGEADWVFAGPGSPTYALRIWQDHKVQQEFLQLLNHGALVLSSAGSMPIGRYVIPVYEIFKAGEDPKWRDGLNVFGELFGVDAIIVPHFNNTQGGNYDTSHCFIGRVRFQELMNQLDDAPLVIGIDEHTGMSINLETKKIEIFGKGQVTLSKAEKSWEIAKGEIDLAQLLDFAR